MGEWYKEKGSHQEVVISSRIRLARNLDGRFFESKLQKEEKEQLAEEVYQSITRLRFDETKSFSDIHVAEVSEDERRSLVERHLVSPDFIRNPEGRRALISKDETTTLMLNEEDHIRMQGLHAGLDFEKSYEFLSKVDDVLDNELHFAYDTRWGYLTACPTNLGTGLRASAMLHLPLTEQSGILQSIQEQLAKLGYTIRGTYGEGSKALGNCYQISNEITLGVSEERVIRSLTEIIKYLATQEMGLRNLNQGIELDDQVYRAVGILGSARLLTFEELMDGVSALRVGVSVGMLEPLTFTQLDQMQLELGDATLMKNEKIREADIRKVRSEKVREILQPII